MKRCPHNKGKIIAHQFKEKCRHFVPTLRFFFGKTNIRKGKETLSKDLSMSGTPLKKRLLKLYCN